MIRIFSVFLALVAAAAAADLSEAKELLAAKKTAEANAVLEKIIATEPKHVDALLLQSKCLFGLKRQEEGLAALEKAAGFAPERSDVQTEYGMACFDMAGIKRSLSLARKGRSVLEAQVAKDPGNVNAHAALFSYFLNAPWIAGGDADKAFLHAKAIRIKEPNWGLALLVAVRLKDKKFDDAFALVDEVLKTEDDNYGALYELGRISSISGKRSKEGISALEKCLTLKPVLRSPGHAGVHYRLGILHKLMGDGVKARTHLEKGLQIEPQNRQLKEALAKLGG